MTATDQSPNFYDDLELSFEKAWAVIEAGSKKRNNAAHTPVVGTSDRQGIPQLRIMVLRSVDRDLRLLRFHTDLRSKKVGEVAENAVSSLLIYDPEQKVQIRLSGVIHTATDQDMLDAAWRQSTTFARRCYMAEAAPGAVSQKPTSGLPEWIEGKQPEESDLSDARANFALLMFEVQSLEWLYLANTGHRRAKWDWDDGTRSWSGTWLIP